MHEVRTYLTLTSGATFGSLVVQYEYEPADEMNGIEESHTIHQISILGIPASNGMLEAMTDDNNMVYDVIHELVQYHIDDIGLAAGQEHSECARKPGQPF